MKGIELKEEPEIQIDLNVTSYIPDEYIGDANQKIEIYQKIALCRTEEDITNIIDEIIDRFGNMPKELENLIEIARIKYLSKELGIEKIASKKTAVVITFPMTEENKELSIDIVELVKTYGNKIKFSAGVKPMITLEMGTNQEKEILKQVLTLVKNIKKGYNKEKQNKGEENASNHK